MNMNQIIDDLCKYIHRIEYDIKIKNKQGLYNDDILCQNLIRDILNECYGWDLQNLNELEMNYPGIDLGDFKKRIGVQVTAEKSSSKITDALDKILKHRVYNDFNIIYFFILSGKQKSYSVAFTKYQDYLECSIESIIDFQDIIKFCLSSNSEKAGRVLSIIEREVSEKAPTQDTDEYRKKAIELNTLFTEIKKAAESKFQNTYITNERVEGGIRLLEDLLPVMDDCLYSNARQALEYMCRMLEGKEYPEVISEWINRNGIIFKNIKLICDNLRDNNAITRKTIPVVLDGDDIIDQLSSLKIDREIILEQISFIKLKELMEDRICRNCSFERVLFSRFFADDNKGFISRLKREGGVVETYENEEELQNKFSDYIRKNQEVAFITDRINNCPSNAVVYGMNIVGNNSEDCHFGYFDIYTMDADHDLPEIFNYQEELSVNIRCINEGSFKKMIANCNDAQRHQLRVYESGDIQLSLYTDIAQIRNLQFRFESFDPYNGYVGPRAASDSKYVHSFLEAVKETFKNGRKGYVDDVPIT